MKKLVFVSFIVLFWACDDGELQIERVDFESVNVQTCAGLDDPTETTFFFKIDQDESLLLSLASGLLENETSTPGALTSTLPSASNLIYRLFSDNVTQDYFCSAIPALEPTVVKENTATAGNIAIDTRVGTATKDNKSYTHTISITGLSLTNDLNESITDNSTLVYGDFTTTTENSAKLETPFSNYAAIADFSRCGTAPADGIVRLYKIINDEFLTMDIPSDSLANMATVDTIPRRVNLENGIFKYVVLDTLVASEMVCTTSPLAEDIESWDFVSTAGILLIETVEGEPDANGTIPFTHTLTLENLILTLQGDGADVDDVPLDEIETVTMGTYTTTLE